MNSLLVIEDDPSTLTRYLSVFKRKGFFVRGTKSLHEAYRLFVEERPDCILMDLHFPDGHALEDFYTNTLLFQEKRGETPCPIVVITASDAEEDLKELMDAGVFAIHSKGDPIDIVEDSIHAEIEKRKKRNLRLLQGDGRKGKVCFLPS